MATVISFYFRGRSLCGVWSNASNLVAGDSPPFDLVLCPSCTGVADIFVHDRDPTANGLFDEGDGVTIRVSVSTGGVAANALSDRPWMSTHGRYVGFLGEATNLTAVDTNGHTDVFIHDLQTGSTILVSKNSSNVLGNFGSDRISLSDVGRFVAFRSKADNLVPGDDPAFDALLCPTCMGWRDVFLRDRDRI